MTAGKFIIKQFVPQDLHHIVDDNDMDKKGINKLFTALAEKHPDKYADVAKKLSDFGFEAATRLGSSVTLNDLSTPIQKDHLFNKLDEDIAKVKSDKTLSEKKKNAKINGLTDDLASHLNKLTLEEGLKNNKTLAKVTNAGARGSLLQLRQTVTSQVTATDNNGKPIFPIKSSYAEGLSLPEYLATSFNRRQGLVTGKISVAQSGYYAKSLARSMMSTRVEMHDCGTHRGISVPTTDMDSVGAYLAADASGYKYNNSITPTMLKDLQNKGVTHIIVRSPITCEAAKDHHNNAVCAMCVGNRDKGLPKVGDFVGVSAGTGISEPGTQLTLKSKHSGKAETGGFALINSISNPSKNFFNKAAVAEEDGKVTGIISQEGGGKNIAVSGKDGIRHYFIAQGLEPKVAIGSEVEQGDVMSDGVVDPTDIVRNKGIGRGRVEYANSLRNAFKDSGINVNRRNFELLARSQINNVEADKEVSDLLPGQIAHYSAIERNYRPRPGAKSVRVDSAKGMYLEQPVLDLTVGTRLTSHMIKELRQHHIDSVIAHDEPSPFTAKMIRLIDVPEYEDDDLLHQLYSTGLEKKLVVGVNEGATANIQSASPVTGIAYGVGFGKK